MFCLSLSNQRSFKIIPSKVRSVGLGVKFGLFTATPDSHKNIDKLPSSVIYLQTFRSAHGQTPFTLTLRIWDIYILEGERVLPAMSYTLLKLHKSKTVSSTN